MVRVVTCPQKHCREITATNTKKLICKEIKKKKKIRRVIGLMLQYFPFLLSPLLALFSQLSCVRVCFKATDGTSGDHTYTFGAGVTKREMNKSKNLQKG